MKALIKTRSHSEEEGLVKLLFAPLLAATLVFTPVAAFASDIPVAIDVQETISPEVAITSVTDETSSENLIELPEIGEASEDYASPSSQDDFTDVVVNEANLPTELPSALIPSDSEQTLSAADTIAPAADTAANDVVYFNDSGLKRCVAKTLGYSVNAQITTSDLRRLTSLDCFTAVSIQQGKGGPVFDITPLQYATNLESLWISGSNLSNLSALRGLTKLRSLKLAGAQISDISALKGLTNIQSLTLANTSVSDITPLKGLIKITWLQIFGNRISDISALKGMTGLRNLYLWDNQVRDISALSGLKELWDLNLSRNRISDFSPLRGLTKIDYLSIGGQTPPIQNRWIQTGVDWWYLDSSGDLARGWALINGNWYHFIGYGQMETGWKQLGGQWYYLSSSGAMKTGWVQTGGAWYYLNASGAMHTGWLQQGKTWYYLKPGGAMVTGNYIINGKVNRFSSSGAWLG